MPKFDITRLNVAIDRLLEVTEKPLHRFILQCCGQETRSPCVSIG
jgi:hypothetical protein